MADRVEQIERHGRGRVDAGRGEEPREEKSWSSTRLFVRAGWRSISARSPTLRSRLGPDRHIIAALKGDAYGHGIGPVARCLARGDVHSLGDGEPPGCGCDPGSSAEIDDFCG